MPDFDKKVYAQGYHSPMLKFTTEQALAKQLAFMRQPLIANFVSSLSDRRHTSKSLYGYIVPLETDEEIRFASILNRNYCRLIWGITNDAVNDGIQPDELEVFNALFDTAASTESVLEMGCGSGRLTKYLAPLTTRLTAIDCDRFVLAKCQEALADLVGDRLSLQRRELTSIAEEDFTAILMMENVVSLILDPNKRVELYRSARRLLRRNGYLVLSVREPDFELDSKKELFQMLPYDMSPSDSNSITAFGFCRIRSLESILTEVRTEFPDLIVKYVFRGGSRPAGGTMRTAVLVN